MQKREVEERIENTLEAGVVFDLLKLKLGLHTPASNGILHRAQERKNDVNFNGVN